MGKLTLYGVDPSPPTRACVLTLHALKLPFEYKQLDLLQGEHLTKEYLAKNPQHTIPTLEDDGKYIWDSHAIMAYLVRKYGKDDSLYPTDFLQCAIVDQRLHFESGVIFQGAIRNITVPVFFWGNTKVPRYKIEATVEVYDFLEIFLRDHPFMAGDYLTIADFSIISSVSSIVAFVEIDTAKYPKLIAWINRLKQLPYYDEANGKGARIIVSMIRDKNINIVDKEFN